MQYPHTVQGATRLRHWFDSTSATSGWVERVPNTRLLRQCTPLNSRKFCFLFPTEVTEFVSTHIEIDPEAMDSRTEASSQSRPRIFFISPGFFCLHLQTRDRLVLGSGGGVHLSFRKCCHHRALPRCRFHRRSGLGLGHRLPHPWCLAARRGGASFATNDGLEGWGGRGRGAVWKGKGARGLALRWKTPEKANTSDN